MNIAQQTSRSILPTLCLVVLAACQPPAPTLIAQQEIQITGITHNEIVTGQLMQTKTFDRCEAAGYFSTEVKFSESTSETFQKSLALTVGAGAEADIPAVAKVKLEGAIEERFAFTKETIKIEEQSVKVEVPEHTRKEYTIIWREKRDEGTIAYVVNGEPRIANYSYRVGLEFDSMIDRDMDCSLPSPTPPPSDTPVPETILLTATPPLQTRTLADGCIFSQTWAVNSTDAALLSSVTTESDGCYSPSSLGIFVDKNGVLHLIQKDKKSDLVSGLYTPVRDSSIIEFKVYVNSMYIVYNNVPTYINFAVASASDPMNSMNTARFKLHVEDNHNKPFVYFMAADAGEYNGVRVKDRHYEYGKTYTIRFELTGNIMNVFINGVAVDEDLEIPVGPKVFYIGYNVPILAGVDAEIRDLTIDGVQK